MVSAHASFNERRRDAPHAWIRFPALRLGHMVGNRGRGRIQLAVRRAFIGHDILTTSQVFDWCFVRDRKVSWKRRHRWSVVRVLDQVAERVGRAPTIGRPILWRLRTRHARDMTNN